MLSGLQAHDHGVDRPVLVTTAEKAAGVAPGVRTPGHAYVVGYYLHKMREVGHGWVRDR